MKGVINLRGRVIPVVDMRLQIGIEAADYAERTCVVVVVVEIATDTAMFPTGIVVDEVSEDEEVGGHPSLTLRGPER